MSPTRIRCDAVGVQSALPAGASCRTAGTRPQAMRVRSPSWNCIVQFVSNARTVEGRRERHQWQPQSNIIHPPAQKARHHPTPVSRMSSHARSLDHDTLSAEASRAHEQCDATSNARVLGIAGLAWPAGSGGFCGHAPAHKSERERVASRQPRDGRDDACVRYLRFLAVHDELHMRTFAHATLAPYTRPMTA